MAQEPKQPRTNQSAQPGRLRLAPLVGGGLGLLSFALAIIRGLAAGNETSAVLLRALVAMFVLAVIGAITGAIAERVMAEQLARMSDEQDEEETEPGVPSGAQDEDELAEFSQTKDGAEDTAMEPAGAHPG